MPTKNVILTLLIALAGAGCVTKGITKKMDNLALYISYLTGDFDNSEQVKAELSSGRQLHPHAKHISRTANHKIKNLPDNFKGVYVIEESYYTYPNQPTITKHHLFLFSLTTDGEVLLRVQTPDNIDNKLLTNDNPSLTLDFNTLADVKRFSASTYTKTERGFYLKAPNDLGNGMRFTLEETIGNGFLEVMELLEKDGKSLTPYTTPLLYKRIK